ncbi:MAG: S-methyl-5-thioribose-1-phosphate isomerase [Acidobacteria bacterium]|nr:MAG: S-methyl-5-thioribose-1-phosphate isomerase [Acidobacteriota bacterium]
MLPTIAWENGEVVMIDQRKLPSREVYVRCRSGRDVAKAIRTMVIRGAPAIGVAAAMGVALELRRSTTTSTTQLATEFYRTCDLLAATRPTAVNLFWAIERMKRVFAGAMRAGQSTAELQATIDAEAARIHDEDVANCRALGRHGVEIMPDEGRVLTHCNAGALATGGYGSALGVVRAAVEAGKRVAVYADETRPFLQGARLTAWELVRDGIDTTVITDGMVGSLMRSGQVDVVVVGADRIAANGDVANKIGTYTVAVVAREHDVPFYVAAPVSTIDLSTPDGSGIPIEERDPREVTHLGSLQLTPEGAKIWNPAFDITPARFVAGIITEHGICRSPFAESLTAVCEIEGSEETGGRRHSASAKASADTPKLAVRSHSASEGGEAGEA